jgi:hypothetical protein
MTQIISENRQNLCCFHELAGVTGFEPGTNAQELAATIL